MISPNRFENNRLSPAHKQSINKSIEIDSKVTQFLKNSTQLQMQPLDLSFTSSLSNSNAYLQSECKNLIRLVNKTNKLYSQKEKEVKELQQKLKQFEMKMGEIQVKNQQGNSIKQKDQTAKSKKPQEKQRLRQSDQDKTRKKPLQIGVPSKTQSASRNNEQTSSFQLTIQRKQNNEKIQPTTSEQLNKKLRKQNQDHQKQIAMQKDLMRKLLNKFQKFKKQVDQIKLQKSQQDREYELLKNKYEDLEQRYRKSEDQFGKKNVENKIMIDNLKQTLANLEKIKSYNKKLSKKEQEGYYSINKKMTQSQQSAQSSFEDSSVSSSASALYKKTLQEQNQYLRDKLIEAYDDRGRMQSELKKCQKKIERLRKEKQQLKRTKNITDENNPNVNNIRYQQTVDQPNTNKFKKNKASILLIQNTEQKQKDIMNRYKISSLLKELQNIINQITDNKISEQSELLEAKPQVLEEFVRKLTEYSTKKSEFLTQLEKIKEQNTELKKQRQQFEEKNRKDIADLQSFLNQLSERKSQIDKQDSTDFAFKNIMLTNQIQIPEQDERYEEDSRSWSRKNLLMQFMRACSRQKDFLEYSNQFSQSSEKYSSTVRDSYHQSIIRLINNKRFIEESNVESEQGYQQISAKVKQLENQKNKDTSLNIRQKEIKSIEQESQSAGKQLCIRKKQKVNQAIEEEIQDDQKSLSLQEMMNKRLTDFQQFSNNWIKNVLGKKSDVGKNEQKPQIQELSLGALERTNYKKILVVQTQRLSSQRSKQFWYDDNDIDARSQSIASHELIRQRLFVRQEVSYMLSRQNSFGNSNRSDSSNRSSSSQRI